MFMKCEGCNGIIDNPNILEIGGLVVCNACKRKTMVNPDITNTREVQDIMATLKEEAMAYEPKQTLNIADLDEVPIDLQVFTSNATNSEGKEFEYKYAEFNGKQYRVPNTVLEEIQKIIKLKPTVTKVRVTKSGAGLGTKYKVDAVD